MPLERRRFLGDALGLGGAALLHACDSRSGEPGPPAANAAPLVAAADRPEVSELRFGIIALTDCSPLVIAHEKGFFRTSRS
ncbi:ABC transporter substrate-binding protein [Sorangium sp. So ce590]|uniref:ABC transporter substrate-binding protein n=1 Tax=unclassified Sorangium TaxID=2621164 RepID=UPI003F633164